MVCSSSCPTSTCFNAVLCVTDTSGNGNALLGLEVDEVFIYKKNHSQGKDGEATRRQVKGMAGGAKDY